MGLTLACPPASRSTGFTLHGAWILFPIIICCTITLAAFISHSHTGSAFTYLCCTSLPFGNFVAHGHCACLTTLVLFQHHTYIFLFCTFCVILVPLYHCSIPPWSVSLLTNVSSIIGRVAMFNGCSYVGVMGSTLRSSAMNPTTGTVDGASINL